MSSPLVNPFLPLIVISWLISLFSWNSLLPYSGQTVMSLSTEYLFASFVC